jgi:hypothetical protein
VTAIGGERIYAVGRLVDEGSAHHARLWEIIRRAHPEAEIGDGVRLWSSNEDWRARWREYLPGVDRVILCPGERGEVGLGGLQELVDAWIAGIPVEIVTPDGVRPLEWLTLGTEVFDLERVAVAESLITSDAVLPHKSGNPHARTSAWKKGREKR